MPQEILLLGDAMPQLLMSASGCRCLQTDRTGLILALIRFMEWKMSSKIDELAPDSAPLHAAGFLTLDAEVVLERLPTEGRFPDWLSGSLVRNGPAKFEAGHDLFNHHFDGFAMLHRFEFRNGEVSYRNRFLRSRSFEYATQKKAEWDTRSSLSAWTPIDRNASRSNSERGTLRMSTRVSP
jgi:carotenoid cleavage dioxygenase-like enzyme